MSRVTYAAGVLAAAALMAPVAHAKPPTVEEIQAALDAILGVITTPEAPVDVVAPVPSVARPALTVPSGTPRVRGPHRRRKTYHGVTGSHARTPSPKVARVGTAPRPVIVARREHGGRWRLGGAVHIVVEGECLSVIAARYGRHWPELAERNDIRGPEFVIYPGQVLALGSGEA
jgi:hypothetical protein